MDQAGSWHPPPQRQVQRLECQLGAQVRPYGPPDHAPREQVEDHRQIQPALPRPEVGDVGDPAFVRALRVEVAPEHVRRHGQPMGAVGGVPEPLLGHAHEAQFPQQAGDPFLAHREAFLLELLVDPRAPVGASAGRMDGSDAHRQPGVLALPAARPALRPRVVATGGDAQHPAQTSYGVVDLLRMNKREPHACSFAKKAAAFFKIVRSSRSTRTSRRRVRSSSFSSVVSPPVGLWA